MPKRILYTALDWGLGHASRSVSVIKELLKQKHEVILGVTPLTDKIFQEELPALQRFDVPALEMEYSKFWPVWFSVLSGYRRLKRIVEKEALVAEEMVKYYGADVIISDNRYGFRSSAVKNIFITHQLQVKSPVGARTGNKIAQEHLQKFDEIWVPDADSAESNLSGDLSHGNFPGLKIRYIGPQSRLNAQALPLQQKFDFLFLLSGPEPLRSLLEKEVLQFISSSGLNCCLVRGSTLPLSINKSEWAVFDLPANEQLSQLMKSSTCVVARSGYSTVMDVVLMKKKALLLPTPGQTEQEYLAEYLNGKFGLQHIQSVNEIAQINHQEIPAHFFESENFLTQALHDL